MVLHLKLTPGELPGLRHFASHLSAAFLGVVVIVGPQLVDRCSSLTSEMASCGRMSAFTSCLRLRSPRAGASCAAFAPASLRTAPSGPLLAVTSTQWSGATAGSTRPLGEFSCVSDSYERCFDQKLGGILTELRQEAFARGGLQDGRVRVPSRIDRLYTSLDVSVVLGLRGRGGAEWPLDFTSPLSDHVPVAASLSTRSDRSNSVPRWVVEPSEFSGRTTSSSIWRRSSGLWARLLDGSSGWRWTRRW